MTGDKAKQKKVHQSAEQAKIAPEPPYDSVVASSNDIKFGRHGITLKSGYLHAAIEAFLLNNPDIETEEVSDFRKRLAEKDDSLANDSRFIKFIKKIGSSTRMILAQDETARIRDRDTRSFDAIEQESVERYGNEFGLSTSLAKGIARDAQIPYAVKFESYLPKTKELLGGIPGEQAKDRTIITESRFKNTLFNLVDTDMAAISRIRFALGQSYISEAEAREKGDETAAAKYAAEARPLEQKLTQVSGLAKQTRSFDLHQNSALPINNFDLRLIGSIYTAKAYSAYDLDLGSQIFLAKPAKRKVEPQEEIQQAGYLSPEEQAAVAQKSATLEQTARLLSRLPELYSPRKSLFDPVLSPTNLRDTKKSKVRNKQDIDVTAAERLMYASQNSSTVAEARYQEQGFSISQAGQSDNKHLPIGQERAPFEPKVTGNLISPYKRVVKQASPKQPENVDSKAQAGVHPFEPAAQATSNTNITFLTKPSEAASALIHNKPLAKLMSHDQKMSGRSYQLINKAFQEAVIEKPRISGLGMEPKSFSAGIISAFGPLANDGDLTGPYTPGDTSPKFIKGIDMANAAISKGAAIYVNGMLGSPEGHLKAAQALSDKIGNTVVGVYNASSGFAIDLLQCGSDKLFGSDNPATIRMTQLLKSYSNLDIYAHSQGTMIVSNALSAVSKLGYDVTKYNVTTFGNASYTYPKGPSYHHYVFSGDPVSLSVGSSGPVGAVMNNNVTRIASEYLLGGITGVINSEAALGSMEDPGKHTTSLPKIGHGAEDYIKLLDTFKSEEKKQIKATKAKQSGIPTMDILSGIPSLAASDRNGGIHSSLSGLGSLLSLGQVSGFGASQQLPKAGMMSSAGIDIRSIRQPETMANTIMENKVDVAMSGLKIQRDEKGISSLPGSVGLKSLRESSERASHFDQFLSNVNPASLSSEIRSKEGPGMSLPTGHKAEMESYFGVDLSNVRLHTGQTAQGAADQISARAFTIGSDIFFGQGTYEPGKAEGQSLLAHEITHVLQQTGTPRPKLSRMDQQNSPATTPIEEEKEAKVHEKTVIKPRMSAKFGGLQVEKYEREYLNYSQDPIGPDDVSRLDRIAAVAFQKAQERIGPVDENILELTVDVDLDLVSLSDEQAGEVWASAILAEIAKSGWWRKQDYKPVVPSYQEQVIHRDEDTSKQTIESATQQGPHQQPVKPDPMAEGPPKPVTDEYARRALVSNSISDIKNIQDFSGVTKAQRINFIQTLLNQRWVGPYDEDALVKIWKSFGFEITRIAGKNIKLWRESVNRGAKLNEMEEVVLQRALFEQSFEKFLVVTTKALLDESERRIKEERKRYGIYTEVDPGIVWDSTKYQMAATGNTRGLTQAAKELNAKIKEIHDSQIAQMNFVTYRCSSGRNVVRVITDRVQYDKWQNTIDQKEKEYDIMRQAREKIYPALASYTSKQNRYQLKNIAEGQMSDKAAMIGKDIDEKLANIAKVREGLASGEFKVWKQPNVVGLAKQLPQVKENELYQHWADYKVEQIEQSEFWKNLGLAVIAIALGIAGAVFSGGTSLAAGIAAAGAAVGGAGISIYTATTNLQEYMMQSAAAGTDFDKAKAISQDDPSLFWLAIDIVGAVLDIGAAFKALRALGPAARAAMAERKALNELREAALKQADELQKEGKLAAGVSKEAFADQVVAAAKRNMEMVEESRKTLATALKEGNHPKMAQLIAGNREAMEELLESHGNWKMLMTQLESGSDEMKKIGKQLFDYRNSIVEKELAQFSAKPVSSASTKLISDVDLSTYGADAGKKLIQAEEYMAAKYGANWSEKFRMNFYTEAGRLTKYQDVMGALEAAKKARLQTEITELTEKFNIAKMLQHAGDNAEAIARVEKMAQKVGVPVTEEMKALAKMDDAARLTKRNQLLGEIDDLVAKFEKATDAEKVVIAEQISKKQIEANFHTVEAAMGPGGGRYVIDQVKVVGHEAYQSALTQIEGMEHIIHEAGGDVIKAAREYEMYKYIARFSEMAENAGVTGERLARMKKISQQVYKYERGAFQGFSDDAIKNIITEFRGLVDDALPQIKAKALADPSAWAEKVTKKPILLGASETAETALKTAPTPAVVTPPHTPVPVIPTAVPNEAIQAVKPAGQSAAQKAFYLSETGRTVPAQLTFPEIKKVGMWQTEARQYISDCEAISTTGLKPRTKALLTMENQLTDHLKPDDIAGMMKERRGVQILKESGKAYDHISEVTSAYNGLKNRIEDIKKQIAHFYAMKKPPMRDIEALEFKRNRLSKLIDNLTATMLEK